MTSFLITISAPFPMPLYIRAVEKIRRWFAVTMGREESTMECDRYFASIMRDYGSIISGICFSYASSADDLKDLRQDIMINIWKGLASFRGDSALSTWIYRVALNTCVSTVRKRSKSPFTISIDLIGDTPEENDEPLKERIDALHSLIQTLSPLDKAVITMWLDERKYEEIADVTGISRNNVAIRINRIKQKLSSLKNKIL